MGNNGGRRCWILKDSCEVKVDDTKDTSVWGLFKDGKPKERVVDDLRGLNKDIIKDSHPLYWRTIGIGPLGWNPLKSFSNCILGRWKAVGWCRAIVRLPDMSFIVFIIQDSHTHSPFEFLLSKFLRIAATPKDLQTSLGFCFFVNTISLSLLVNIIFTLTIVYSLGGIWLTNILNWEVLMRFVIAGGISPVHQTWSFNFQVERRKIVPSSSKRNPSLAI